MTEEGWKKWAEEFDRESRRVRTQISREKDPEKKAALRVQLKRMQQKIKTVRQTSKVKMHLHHQPTYLHF